MQTESPVPQKIHAAIIGVMREVGPIAKSSRNDQQRYNYRGIDAVYNACHPIFAKHGIYSTSQILDAQHRFFTSAAGKDCVQAVLKVRFTYWAEDGSSVWTEVVAEGLDYGGDKASNKAMSAADKYALLQLLKIPVAAVDSDASGPPKSENTTTRRPPSVAPRSVREEVQPLLDRLTSITERWKIVDSRLGGSNHEDDFLRFVMLNTKVPAPAARRATSWAEEDFKAAESALADLEKEANRKRIS